MQILTFFSKNSLSIYTALKKYRIRGSKIGHIRNFQVMPILILYKLHLDIFFRPTRARVLADFPTSGFTTYINTFIGAGSGDCKNVISWYVN